MTETIAFAALAYGGLLGFVLTLLTAAKRGDQGRGGEVPRALLVALERERRRSANRRGGRPPIAADALTWSA